MAGVKITTCDKKCKSTFQDKTYGQDQRVHNLGKNNEYAKCTVCGNKKKL